MSKAFRFLEKMPGIRNGRVRLVMGAVATFIAGVVIYVIQVSPLDSVGSSNQQQQKNDPAKASKSTIEEIAKTAPAIVTKPAESLVIVESNPAVTTPTVIRVSSNNQSQQQQSTEDSQIKQLEEQARMKRIKASYDAYGAKATMGTPSQKNNSSNPVVANNRVSGTEAGESGGVVNDSDSPYLNSELIKPKTPYLVQAGSIIPAVMISGLNSDISGQIVAQVRENVYDSISGKYLLVPQGSKLVGQFSNQIAYGQDRIAVAWQRVIYPNGYSISLKGIPGSDVAGFSGFYDQVDNHYWRIFGASFVMGVITAGMQYSQNNTNSNVQSGGYGFTNPNPTVGQTVAGSLGQQLGSTGMMITQKNLNIAPTITIRQGYKFTIMMTADVALKPYKQGN